MTSINKTFAALAIAAMAFGANAQVDKAASNASDAAQHKLDQKRAESKAADSGPIGKAVNNTKAEYHKEMAEKDANDAKRALNLDAPQHPKSPAHAKPAKPSSAAVDAKDAMEHKAAQKDAEHKAAHSTGPVDKAVNETKAKYHKGMAEHNANEAKEASTPKR